MNLIPRSKMPQVDSKDLPELVACAFQEGKHPSFEVVTPSELHSRQRVSHARALAMPEWLLHKPVLVSSDGIVLDGNHRWYATRVRKMPLTIIRIGLTFDEARPWLLSLHFVYTLARKTPIRN